MDKPGCVNVPFHRTKTDDRYFQSMNAMYIMELLRKSTTGNLIPSFKNQETEILDY